MICTFGDTTDVMWWRELAPADARRDRLRRSAARRAARARGEAGPTARRALRASSRARRSSRRRRASSSCSPSTGELDRRAEADHAPGEVLREGRPPARDRHHRASGTSATAGATPSCAPRCSTRGEELRWHPTHMRVRYEHWVEGLNGDWLISRQRFFGVPFPVWYPLDADGEPDYDAADRSRRSRPARSIRRATRRRATPRTSAASPAASSAIPT